MAYTITGQPSSLHCASQWIPVIAPIHSLPLRFKYLFTLPQRDTYSICHYPLFQDLHGAALLRYRNLAAITVFKYEQRPNRYGFSACERAIRYNVDIASVIQPLISPEVTPGTRGLFSRATGSFVSSAEGRRHERRGSLFKTLPKPEPAHEKPLAPRVP